MIKLPPITLVNNTKKTPPANFFAKTPRTSHNIQIYVLPTVHNKFVFQPRMPLARNGFERWAVTTAYIFRKWRYTISDIFGASWHSFGQNALAKVSTPSKTGVTSNVGSWIYRTGNRLTTRRAADEYFFKSVPHHIEHVSIRVMRGSILPEYLTFKNAIG
jgi:hypothetical protein